MRVKSFISKNSKFVLTYPIAILLALMALNLLQDQSWFLGFFFLISALLIIYIYSISKKIPGKYLLPGVLLLILFQVYPAVYSGFVAFTNDSNGHQISKEQAIKSIIEDSNSPIIDLAPTPFRVAIENETNQIFIIFQDQASQFWAGNNSTLRKLSPSAIAKLANGRILQVSGYRVKAIEQNANYASELQELAVKLPDGKTYKALDFETLEAYEPTFTYNRGKDQLTDLQSGIIYKPNDNGQMASPTGEVLYPGWKAIVGFRNFTAIVDNEEIRRPIVTVLIWTFINAILCVGLSFLMGLSLALTFNSPHLRSRRIYRTIFIIPMAIPSVLSFLVWAGLFTSETGVIDRLFHISTPWLTDAFWAKVAVLIVELWITFPYMFLITTGAIQSIPNEILEAAEIDGASPLKSFRLIKLPLVLRTVAPLLVASGAMALNNFGAIYLLTGGGPTFANSNGNAGATDILISYTYKLAFNANEGNNYGLASALSILNFILVGCLSIYGFKRMKTMEGVN